VLKILRLVPVRRAARDPLQTLGGIRLPAGYLPTVYQTRGQHHAGRLLCYPRLPLSQPGQGSVLVARMPRSKPLPPLFNGWLGILLHSARR